VRLKKVSELIRNWDNPYVTEGEMFNTIAYIILGRFEVQESLS